MWIIMIREITHFNDTSNSNLIALRTLELPAQLSGTRDCLRELFPQVCGGPLCDFLNSSY